MTPDEREQQVKELAKIVAGELSQHAKSVAYDLTEHAKQVADKLHEEVGKEINEKVNDKIDKVHKILEKQNENMDVFVKRMEVHVAKTEETEQKRDKQWEQIEPFIQAKAGFGVLLKWVIGAGALSAAWLAIKGVFIK